MKILVIEDNEKHRQAARDKLKGHEFTIVSSFDEAVEAMHRDPHEDYYRPNKIGIMPDFEVVLTDMMMPMSQKGTASKNYQPGVEVPYGFILALIAAQMGVKYIAMVTDSNHHSSAISSALNFLGGAYYQGDEKPFEINGAKCLFLHSPFIEEFVEGPCRSCDATGVCDFCNGTGKDKEDGEPCVMCKDHVGKCYQCKGAKRCKQKDGRKDWGRVLNRLIRCE